MLRVKMEESLVPHGNATVRNELIVVIEELRVMGNPRKPFGIHT